MVSIASLSMEVNTSDVNRASDDLDKFQSASKKAEAATDTLAAATTKLSANTKQAGVSAAQTAAALRGVPAQFTDIVTSLQGGQAPLTVLLQQGGQLKDMFGGIGPAARALGGYVTGLINPFTLAAGAAGVLALAYNKGSEEADAYRQAIVLSGNAAGTSADQLATLAQQVSATVGTTGAAASVLAQLAGSGKVASASFGAVAEAALKMEEATGRAAEQTVAEFVEIGKDPVAAAKKLNDQYNFLTAATYSQIRALEKQGDTVGAAKLLTEAYSKVVHDRTKEILNNLGTVESAWNGIKKAASDAIDATLGVGRTRAIDEQIANYQTILDNRKDSFLAKMFPDTLGPNSQSTKFIQEQIDALKKRRAEIEANAKADATFAAKQAEGIKKIDEQYKPKTGSNSLDMTAFNTQQNAVSAVLSSYSNAEKELEAAQRAGLVSQADYAARHTELVKQEARDVAAAYQEEITALEAIRSKSTTTASQRIQLDEKIADAREKAAQAQQGYESQMRTIATAETGRLKQQEQAILSYTAALQESLRISQQQLDASLAGLGMGDKAAQRAQERLRIEQEYQNKAEALSRDLRTKRIDQGEYDQESAALQDALNKRLSMQEDYYQKVGQAEQDWTLGAKSSIASYFESANNMAAQSRNLFDDAFTGMEDAVVSFAKTGKFSFSNFTESVIEDLARIAARQAVVGIFSTVAGAIGGGAKSAGSTSAGYSSSIMSDFFKGHSDGGYTGDGGKFEPMGIVHGGEFVLRKEIVSQPGMRDYLERLNAKGYADGGYVGAPAARLTGGSSTAAPQVNITINRDGSSDVSGDTDLAKNIYPGVVRLIQSEIQKDKLKSASSGGALWLANRGKLG